MQAPAAITSDSCLTQGCSAVLRSAGPVKDMAVQRCQAERALLKSPPLLVACTAGRREARSTAAAYSIQLHCMPAGMAGHVGLQCLTQ